MIKDRINRRDLLKKGLAVSAGITAGSLVTAIPGE